MGGGKYTYRMSKELNRQYPPLPTDEGWSTVQDTRKKPASSSMFTGMVTSFLSFTSTSPTTTAASESNNGSNYLPSRSDTYREIRVLKSELTRGRAETQELRQELKTLTQQLKLKDECAIKLKEQYRIADQEIRQLYQDLDTADVKVAASKEFSKKLEEEINNLEEHKTKLEELLSERRDFSETKDSSDIFTLILGLNDLNTQVEDLAFEIFVSCALELENHVVTLDLVNYVKYTFGDLSTFRLAQDKLDCKMEENFLHLLQSLLHESLLKAVHKRFHFSLFQGDLDQVLEKIHFSLQESGKACFFDHRQDSFTEVSDLAPQSQHSRWRLQTLQALDANVDKFHSQKEILDFVRQHVICFLDAAGIQIGIEQFDSAIESLVANSIAWNRLHRYQYLSSDFTIISLPQSQVDFDATIMFEQSDPGEVTNGPNSHSEVLGLVGLGLNQRKTITVGNTSNTVLVKAEVILKKPQLFLSHDLGFQYSSVNDLGSQNFDCIKSKSSYVSTIKTEVETAVHPVELKKQKEDEFAGTSKELD